jgi:hypothetical protein
MLTVEAMRDGGWRCGPRTALMGDVASATASLDIGKWRTSEIGRRTF